MRFTSEKGTVTSIAVRLTLRLSSLSASPAGLLPAFRLFSLCALTLGCPSLAQTPEAALEKIPQFDFSALAAPAKKELFDVLKDEFDACGRPLTLLASIKKGDACKHTKRMVSWAAGAAKEGLTASEIITQFAKYQQSFTAKRNSFEAPDERLCQGAKAADAKVTLVEFSDFQCPFCAIARPMLEATVKSKPQLRVCYAPFPLSVHAQSTVAAQAALFARDNGKFWPMHDALFINQQSLSEESIIKLAVKAGLDGPALQKAIAQKKYLDEIAKFKDAGSKAGLDSTPTMYLNGRKLTLAPTEAVLKLAVEDELDWAAQGNTFSGVE